MLENLISSKCFSHQVVQKLFKKSLQNIYNPKSQCSTVERKAVFINLPYIGKDSFIIKKNVELLISRFYPQVKPIFCFRSSFTIGSLFRVNPFPPSVPIWQRLAKLSILILEGTIKKISYERRDYESVDEKSLS